MKFAAVSVFLALIFAMAVVSRWPSKATYTLDLGIEYRVVDFTSEKEIILEWRDGGHRTAETIESLTVLTNGQPVTLQAVMQKGLFGLWPARTIRFLAQPAP